MAVQYKSDRQNSGVLLLSQEDTIAFANSTILSALDKSLDQVIGKQISDLFVFEDLSASEQIKEQLLHNQTASVDLEIEQGDNIRHSFRCLIQKLPAKFINDSEAIKQQKYINSSREEELQMLFESITEMMILIDYHGQIVEKNPAFFKKVLGDSAMSPGSIFDWHSQDQIEAIRTALEEVEVKGNSSIELQLKLANGELMDTELELAAGSWHGQSVIICIYRDIHHRIQAERLENERRNLADALAISAAVLNSSLNLDDVMDHILQTVGLVIPITNTNIIVLDGNKGRVVASRGYDQLGTKELIDARILEVSKVKNLARMIETKRELVIPDTKNSSDWIPFPESFWIQSYVGAPIVVNDKVYGFINCDSEFPEHFNESHALALKLFADQAATAIDNARLHNEVKHRVDQLTQITELTRTVLVSGDVNEVIQKLSEPIRALFNANSIIVTKWDGQRRMAQVLSAKGSGIKPSLQHESEPETLTLSEFVLQKKKPVVFIHSELNKKIRQQFDKYFLDANVLALPLLVKDNLFGVIFLGFTEREKISEDEISVGEYAATQLATAIQKSLTLETEQQRNIQYLHANELIASLSRVASSINNAAGLQGVMETMGTGLEKMHIHSMVFLLDETQCSFRLEYASRQNEMLTYAKNFEMNYIVDTNNLNQISEFQKIIQDRQTIFVNDVFPLFVKIIPEELVPFKHRVMELMGVTHDSKALILPLISENKPIGVLNIYGKELLEIDQKAGEVFSGQISVALENAKLLAKVQQIAITDELTSILNRRGLFEHANLQYKSACRHKRDLSVLMIDIDDFKKVNDTYGHDIGDQVLSEVVRRIKGNIRDIDVLGRYGGEEFMVLLSETDLSGAKVVGERLRSLIDNSPISTNSGMIHVTISIGIGILKSDTQSFEQICKGADEALYSAKKRGKNQVATLTG